MFFFRPPRPPKPCEVHVTFFVFAPWAAKTVQSSCDFFCGLPLPLWPPKPCEVHVVLFVRRPGPPKPCEVQVTFCSSPWAAKADRGSGDCFFSPPWAAKIVQSKCFSPLGRQNRAKFMWCFFRSPGPPNPTEVQVIVFFSPPWAAKTVRSSCDFLFVRPLGRQNRAEFMWFSFFCSPPPLVRQNRAKF